MSTQGTVAERPSGLLQLFPLTLPRQHGAWTILLAALLIGTWTGGQGEVSPRTAALFVAALAGFSARHTALLYYRLSARDPRRTGLALWAGLQASLLVIPGLWLVLAQGLWLLVPLGGLVAVITFASLFLALHRLDMTLGSEVLAILGLSLAAPAAEYCTIGAFTPRTLAVWVLCAAYFVGGLIHVRGLMRRRGAPGRRPLPQRVAAARLDLAYHLAVPSAFGVAGLMVPTVPPLSAVALLPSTLKAASRVLSPRPLAPRQIGWVEVLHTLLFIFLAGFAFTIP